MRIYKKDPTATNLKPILALHGGGWVYRNAPFIGMETQISHLTERGFIVFAPLYPLAGELGEAEEHCEGTSRHRIESNVNNALNWVIEHGEQYGAAARATRPLWTVRRGVFSL